MWGTKDFVDQGQCKLQGLGNMPTGVTRCLHRFDARKSLQIEGGSSIGQEECLPGPAALADACRRCQSAILHLPPLSYDCRGLARATARHTANAVARGVYVRQ